MGFPRDLLDFSVISGDLRDLFGINQILDYLGFMGLFGIHGINWICGIYLKGVAGNEI